MFLLRKWTHRPRAHWRHLVHPMSKVQHLLGEQQPSRRQRRTMSDRKQKEDLHQIERTVLKENH
jgi:hypothetical protein